MTNGQLRGSLLTMQVALNKVQGDVFSGDDTPNNLDNRQWWKNASDAISEAQSTIPSGSDEASEVAAKAFNYANTQYKVFVSTWGEFGNTEWPSFADAVWNSIKELPETIGGAVGSTLGGITDELGKGLKKGLGGFFGSLGPWGWLILIGASIALLTYIYPQWTLAVRGLLYK